MAKVTKKGAEAPQPIEQPSIQEAAGSPSLSGDGQAIADELFTTLTAKMHEVASESIAKTLFLELCLLQRASCGLNTEKALANAKDIWVSLAGFCVAKEYDNMGFLSLLKLYLAMPTHATNAKDFETCEEQFLAISGAYASMFEPAT